MRTPWHLWLVGILSLLWNGMGALDFTMTQTRNSGWMAAFTPEQLEYFYALPLWVVVAWGLGTWGAVAGSVLLLLRSALAIWAFVASLAGITLTWLWRYVLSPVDMPGDDSPGALAFSAAIVLVTFLLLWYARAMKVRGVLQ